MQTKVLGFRDHLRCYLKLSQCHLLNLDCHPDRHLIVSMLRAKASVPPWLVQTLPLSPWIELLILLEAVSRLRNFK